jgi:hypothetical protein
LKAFEGGAVKSRAPLDGNRKYHLVNAIIRASAYQPYGILKRQNQKPAARPAKPKSKFDITEKRTEL